MERETYLGRGLKFPTNLVNGRATIVTGRELIQQSIYIILATPLGERFMLPEFGSRCEELIFEHNDDILKSMLRLFISMALETWEKRIKFLNVTYEQVDETMLCTITYRILSSNEIDSYIYPFYRKLNY